HALRNHAEHIHQRLVRLKCLGRKARNDAAEVVLAKSRAGVDGAGQEAFAQRTEWHKADPEFFQSRQNFTFRLAPPQRELALQGSDGLDGVGTMNRLRASFGQSEMPHLASGDEILDRTGDLL